MVWRMVATDTNRQILIVDRDVAAVEPLRQKLGEAGFVVRVITDGSAVLIARSLAMRPTSKLCAASATDSQLRTRWGGMSPSSHFYRSTRCSTPKCLFCKQIFFFE